jgi:hypothetical protein
MIGGIIVGAFCVAVVGYAYLKPTYDELFAWQWQR